MNSVQRIALILLSGLWLLLSPVAQREPLRFRIAFYNAENLFDCRHDSLKDDMQYLPEGKRHWTLSRYWQKQRRLAEVIASIGGDNAPALVGLCEVENDSVLTDLTRRSPLRTVGYRYIVTHGDDPRGIDVALLYRPSHFRLLGAAEHPVPVRTLNKDAHARPVLHASGMLLSGDTLDVLVCHWPSRLEGTRASEPLRSLAASVVQHLCDSIFTVRTTPLILVMGDFNEPSDSPAVLQLEENAHLVNLGREAKPTFGEKASSRTPFGTYRYKGRWEQLDQMLASPLLAERLSSLLVYDAPFLLEKEPFYGGRRPFRTFNGYRYKGGYSDHLPIYIDLEVTY